MRIFPLLALLLAAGHLPAQDPPSLKPWKFPTPPVDPYDDTDDELPTVTMEARTVTERKFVAANPPSPRKYLMASKWNYTSSGIVLTYVPDNSPLKRLKLEGSNKYWGLQPGHIISKIQSGNGDLFKPNSQATHTAIINSLTTPTTQIQVTWGNRQQFAEWYTIELTPNPAKAAAAGGKVVVLMIGDTHDQDVGPEIKKENEAVQSLFETGPQKRHVKSVLALTGQQVKSRGILVAVQGLTVGPNDTLFCFVNCHGGYEPRPGGYANGHFFQMADKNRLPRQALRAALDAKGARLTCLISNACNTRSNAPREFSVPVATTTGENLQFNSLFLEPRGVIDVNSAKQDESAMGGLFCEAFYGALLQRGDRTTWRTFLTELRQKTNEAYHAEGGYKGQPHQTVWVYAPSGMNARSAARDIDPSSGPLSAEPPSFPRVE